MTDQTPATQNVRTSLIHVTHLIYGLHASAVVIGLLSSATVAGGLVFGLPSLAGVVLNYWMRSEVRGTWLDAHFRWQIRTFWFTLLWLVVYGLLIVTIIGIPVAWLLIFILGIWVAYRVLRGWLALKNGELPPVSAKQ